MLSKEQEYPLDQTETEGDRLNAQHDMLIKYELYLASPSPSNSQPPPRTTGYLLHPAISTHLIPHRAPKIADLATGTGIFLLSLSQTLPLTTHLDGYDLSPAKFPTSLPQNVHLYIWDTIIDPVPEHLHGLYDVVHIRYFTAALAAHDWITVARKAYTMLKPGGWIQWTEFDMSTLTVMLRGGPITSHHAPAHETLFSLPPVHAFHHGTTNGPPLLPSVLSEAGFEVLGKDVVAADRYPEVRKERTRQATRALVDMVRFRGGLGGEDFGEEGLGPQGLEGLERRLGEEIETGFYLPIFIWTFLGRKGG